MSLLNTLLGSSKKLKDFPNELHYGYIFPQLITSQSTGVSPTVCPRAALPVRTKPQLTKEKSFSKRPGQRGDNNSKTERLWLPALTAKAQPPATNPPCCSQIPPAPAAAAAHNVLSQRGSSLLQSLLLLFPLCRVAPTAWGAGWQLRQMLGRKRNVSS